MRGRFLQAMFLTVASLVQASAQADSSSSAASLVQASVQSEPNAPAIGAEILYENPEGTLFVFNPVIHGKQSSLRCLSFSPPVSGNPIESCIDEGDLNRVVFPYIQFALVGSHLLFQKEDELFATDPTRIALLGLGGGSFSSALLRMNPKTHVHIFELDLDVLGVARTHFGLKSGVNLRVFVEDAVKVFCSPHGIMAPYDIIFQDVHDGKKVPESFFSEEFIKSAAHHLTPLGFLIVNFPATQEHAALLESLPAQYKPFFPHHLSFAIGNVEESHNRLYFFSKSAFPTMSTILDNLRRSRERLLSSGIPEATINRLAEALDRISRPGIWDPTLQD